MNFSLTFTNHLQKYIFIENLGEGTFGNIDVYKCDHFNIFKKCKNVYVVKKIKSHDINYKKSMMNEWTIDKILSHDNIRRIIDIDIINYSLIYEYQPQYIDLFYFLEKNLFIKETSSFDKVIDQMKNVFEYMQDKCIAHMDLKLENILIDKEYNIKLIDFGNAIPFKINNKSMSIKGLKTTLEYASPEQFKYTPYDPSKVDFWAFGIILIGLFKDYYPWDKAILSDKYFFKFYENKTKILNSLKIDYKYHNLLYNLLNIDPKERTFSFKNPHQNKRLLRSDNFFAL